MSSRKKPFSQSRNRSRFKVINWPDYNNTLRNRGLIDFMIAENFGSGWYASQSDHRKRGGQTIYSDHAILLCLQIRFLFGLKLRQTQGFITYLFVMAGIKLRCPDYTPLSKRGKSLCLDSLLGCHDKMSNYVCIDSAGI